MRDFRLLFTAIFMFIILGAYSQTVGISNVEHAPDTNAVLDIYSTDKGIIIPRVDDTTDITDPTKGYLVYINSTHSIWFFDSNKWCELSSSQKDVNITDSMYLGTSNNHVRIEEDGTVVLVGEATTYEDLKVPALTMKWGSNPPEVFLIFPGSGIRGLNFGSFLLEEVYFMVQLPHNYKEGTDLFPHVHWMPRNASSSSGNVEWKLEYTWANNEGTFSSPTTISVIDASDGVDYKHQIADFSTDIDGTGKTISSMLICRLYRDGQSSNANDTYNDEAILLEFDFHYEVNSFGSRLEYIK